MSLLLRGNPTNRGSAGRESTSRRTRPRNLSVILGLTVLAIAQLVLIGTRGRALGSEPEFLTGGDDVSIVSFGLDDGTVVRLGEGRRTLLMVFDPGCPHTAQVAPLWREWLASVDAGNVRLLAVAPGLPGPAAAYAREMGWRVQVANLEGLDDDTIRTIAGRVPWAIAIDEEGVVVSEDHGSKLAEVARSLFGPIRIARSNAQTGL